MLQRPWGYLECLSFIPNKSLIKLLKVYPGQRLSLQKHCSRDEHWIVINGVGNVTKDKSVYKVERGDYVKIERNELHRVENISNCDILIIAEIQICDYKNIEESDNDITRFEDDYNRLKTIA